MSPSLSCRAAAARAAGWQIPAPGDPGTALPCTPHRQKEWMLAPGIIIADGHQGTARIECEFSVSMRREAAGRLSAHPHGYWYAGTACSAEADQGSKIGSATVQNATDRSARRSSAIAVQRGCWTVHAGRCWTVHAGRCWTVHAGSCRWRSSSWRKMSP